MKKSYKKERWGAPIDVAEMPIIRAVDTILGKVRRHYGQLTLRTRGDRLVARDQSGRMHLIKGVGAAAYSGFRGRAQVMTGTIELGPLPEGAPVAEGQIPGRAELGNGYGHGPFRVSVWPDALTLKAA